jgi:hypothetical protein
MLSAHAIGMLNGFGVAGFDFEWRIFRYLCHVRIILDMLINVSFLLLLFATALI